MHYFFAKNWHGIKEFRLTFFISWNKILVGKGEQMKIKKVLICLVICIAYFIICGNYQTQAATNVNYFYGEIIQLENSENTQLLLNEVKIDAENSNIKNEFIIKNNNSEKLFTKAKIKLEDPNLGLAINNLSIVVNSFKISNYEVNSDGIYSFYIEIPAGEAKKIDITYTTENSLRNAKIIKYSLENSKWNTIKCFKSTISLPEEDIPLVNGIYPQCYTFENNSIGVEYYDFKVNALTNNVILKKDTYQDLLYGREANLTDYEEKALKSAKEWINNGVKINYNKYTEENIWTKQIYFKDSDLLEDNIGTKDNPYEKINEAVDSVVNYAISKQVKIDKRNDLTLSYAESIRRDCQTNYVLTNEYIMKNNSRDFWLYGKTVSVDYVESEGDKDLYVYKNTNAGEEDAIWEYLKVSERDILKVKNNGNWYSYSNFGQRYVYVGSGIDGEKLDVTEEEKIEYVNMINSDLYIRIVIYDGMIMIPYSYQVQDNNGQMNTVNEELMAPSVIGYYKNADREIAEKYLALKSESGEYYNIGEKYSKTIKKFPNEYIENNEKVPTVAHSIGFRTQKDGKYVIEFGQFGYSNGLGNIEDAIKATQAQKLIKENQARNAKIKNNALEEINNAVITEDTKEAMPEVKENVEEISKENKFFVEEYKNYIVLGSLAIVAIVCIVLIIVFSIKNKRKK